MSKGCSIYTRQPVVASGVPQRGHVELLRQAHLLQGKSAIRQISGNISTIRCQRYLFTSRAACLAASQFPTGD